MLQTCAFSQCAVTNSKHTWSKANGKISPESDWLVEERKSTGVETTSCLDLQRRMKAFTDFLLETFFAFSLSHLVHNAHSNSEDAVVSNKELFNLSQNKSPDKETDLG